MYNNPKQEILQLILISRETSVVLGFQNIFKQDNFKDTSNNSSNIDIESQI